MYYHKKIDRGLNYFNQIAIIRTIPKSAHCPSYCDNMLHYGACCSNYSYLNFKKYQYTPRTPTDYLK